MSCPVFVINLDRSRDRLVPWSRFQDVERISAVDGSKIDLDSDKRVSLRAKRLVKTSGDRLDHFDINTKGAIGCYLSHVKACQLIVNRRIPLSIVCEDDLAINNVPKDYVNVSDYVLDNVKPEDLGELTVINQNPWFASNAKPFKFVGTHCLIWTLEGAMKFLGACFPIEGHVDHVMSILSEMGMLDVRPAYVQGMSPDGKFHTLIKHDPIKCVTRSNGRSDELV